MPNRDLRESALTSKTLARLSHGAERFFFRLTLVADDFGRFEADPMVLAARCFPAMLDKVKPSHVKAWLEELLRAGLITRYCLGEKTFGEFKTWMKHQRQRAKFSKYPSPADADICRHVSSYARESPASASEEPVVPEEPEDTVTTEEPALSVNGHSPPPPGGFARLWSLNPRKVNKAEAERAYRKLAPDAILQPMLEGALTAQRTWPDRQGRFFPHLATWLHGQRWNDEPPAAALLTDKTAGNLDVGRRFVERYGRRPHDPR